MDKQHLFVKAHWPRDLSISLSICSSSQWVTQEEEGPSVALVSIYPLTPLAINPSSIGAQLGPRCGSGELGSGELAWIRRSMRGEFKQALWILNVCTEWSGQCNDYRVSSPASQKVTKLETSNLLNLPAISLNIHHPKKSVLTLVFFSPFPHMLCTSSPSRPWF